MDSLLLLFQAPPLAVQLVIDGIQVGAIFALAAYGMALVWGVMNIINVVQGEFVILGGYVAYLLTLPFSFVLGWPDIDLGFLVLPGMSIEIVKPTIHPLFWIPVAALALYVLGYLLYRLVIFRLVERDLFTSLLATFGMSILLQQLMNELFGADVQTVDTHLKSWFLFGGLVTISQIRVVAFVIVIVIAVLLVQFLRRSRMGQAIRATAQNARAARILGIDTDRVYATTYALNAAICGAAGALVVMSLTIHPYQGLIYTVRSFTIVVVAGLGNLAGVVAAAFGLGIAEQFAGFTMGAQYQLAFVYLLLVAILVYRNLRLQRQRRYLK